MSNLGAEDPWANGWAEESEPSATTPFSSTFLTPSQLLNVEPDPEPVNDFKFDESKLPSTYKMLYEKLKPQLVSVNDFERLVLDKLVAGHQFSGYQRTRIVNTIFDHNLSNFSYPSNFYQTLGLVALELDVAGTGDYVTLQFKIKDLPTIPSDVVDMIITDESSDSQTFMDPLNRQLAESTISDEPNDKPPEIETVALPELNKYITQYRDEFRPLWDPKQIINIKEVPEKEGLIFKHINYVITHEINLGFNAPSGVKKVLRRYSDFVWYVKYSLFGLVTY